MKTIRIVDLARELNIYWKIICEELPEVIKELEKKNPNYHYLLDKTEDSQAKVFALGEADIDFIRSGPERKLCFMDLAVNLSISSKDMNLLLSELLNRKIISKELHRYYTDLKNKPSVRAWFEPETVVVGENAILTVEINSPCEILEPTLSIDTVSGLELDEEPESPQKILRGKQVEKYQYSTATHGIIKIGVKLGGIIEGVEFDPEKVATASLTVLPMSPEITVANNQDSYVAFYQYQFGLSFDIRNKGSGIAQNVELRGIDRHPEFDVFEPTKIGNVAAHGNVKYRINLRPKKSGLYRFNDLTLYYEDLAGKAFNSSIPELEVNVSTPKPKLKAEMLLPDIVEQKRIFNLTVKIQNIGEGDAKNVSFTLPVDPKIIQAGIIDCQLSRLRSNETEEIVIKLQAPEKDELEIPSFTVEMQDIEGKRIVDQLSGTTMQIRKSGALQIKPTRTSWPFRKNYVVGGQYQIIDEIGEGAFGQVYLVKRTKFNEELALKALKADFVTNPTIVADFIAEAELSKSLTQDNIVRVQFVDKEEHNGLEFPYILMEYVKGGTLRDKLHPGEPLDFVTCLFLMNDVVAALVYAHQRGKIHFDVKPSNIFYDSPEKRWKLGDFGLAKAVEAGEKIYTRGSLPYMAPELREGNGTVRSDVYSLGKVLREILTGDMNGDIRGLEKTYGHEYREILRELAILVDKMLSNKPADRPNIGEVQKIIRKSITMPAKMSNK